MSRSDRPSLDEQLARLALEVTPRTDLWPRIARRIGTRPARWIPLALAASLGGISIAAALTWMLWQERSELRPHERRTPDLTQSAAGRESAFDEPRDPRYQRTRAALEKTFAERVARLDPGARRAIAANLEQIRAARADLRRELAAHPENPVLQHLLESSWHDEFDLYDDVVTGTQPTLARN
ncbi:MAG TPA: hypothetical protein VKT22_07905 [Steroidobacteraceae bacterium]|nr:hypothetical protein [Steroidobacteraceae bacterium]